MKRAIDLALFMTEDTAPAPAADATVETAPIEPTAPTETRGEGEPPTAATDVVTGVPAETAEIEKKMPDLFDLSVFSTTPSPSPAPVEPPAEPIAAPVIVPGGEPPAPTEAVVTDAPAPTEAADIPAPAEPVVTDASVPGPAPAPADAEPPAPPAEPAEPVVTDAGSPESEEKEKRVKTTDDLPKKLKPLVPGPEAVETGGDPKTKTTKRAKTTDDLFKKIEPLVPGPEAVETGGDPKTETETVEPADALADASKEGGDHEPETETVEPPAAPPVEPVADAPAPGPAPAPAVDFENIKKHIKKGAAEYDAGKKQKKQTLKKRARTADDLPEKIESPEKPIIDIKKAIKEQIERNKETSIKNQIDNAPKDVEEKKDIVKYKEEELKRREAGIKEGIDGTYDDFDAAVEGRDNVAIQLEQAKRELDLSKIFVEIVDGLGGSTEDKVPMVKAYNGYLDMTDDIKEKIELAKGFKNIIDKNKELSEKEKEVEKIKNNKGTEADLNKAKKEALQAEIEVQNANIELEEMDLKLAKNIFNAKEAEWRKTGTDEDKQKSEQARAELEQVDNTLSGLKEKKIELEEELKKFQIQSPEDTQDPFNDIDDNDEQDLSAKTLGEKIANKISNYFSLKEVRERKEKRENFFNKMKSDVKEFVFKKLHFEDAAEKVKKIKEKIEGKVKDLKETVSTYIKNKINLKKLIERGKEIVQNIAQKIGESIKNAKLYFADRVEYYTNKAGTIMDKTAKKVDELSSEKDAIDKSLKNITREDLTFTNVLKEKKGKRLEKKINKKIIKMNEKLKKIEAQNTAAQETVGVKQKIEKVIKDNNINTKDLKENIKSLKKERRKLKLICFSMNAVKLVNGVTEETKEFLNEENGRINEIQTELGAKQEMLKEVRKAKLRKTFSNDKTKLEQTLENLQQANDNMQKLERDNSNSLSV